MIQISGGPPRIPGGGPGLAGGDFQEGLLHKANKLSELASHQRRENLPAERRVRCEGRKNGQLGHRDLGRGQGRQPEEASDAS